MSKEGSEIHCGLYCMFNTQSDIEAILLCQQVCCNNSISESCEGLPAATFTKLKHLMAGLLDSLHVTPEDSAAKSRHEMTSFIHKDDYLLPMQKMHCIMLFINNVAYANCLQGFVGELMCSNDPDATTKQFNGIHSYYSTLLEIPI